jgi:hypothetical protein
MSFAILACSLKTIKPLFRDRPPMKKKKIKEKSLTNRAFRSPIALPSTL